MQASSWKYLGALALVALAACNPQLDEADVGEPELAVIKHSLVDTCDSRDNTLLASLKTADGARHCVLNEDCPWGSHCDRSTGLCDWQCLEGGEEGTECPDFGACDCSGRCPSTAPSGTPTVLPRLEAQPYFLHLQVPEAGTEWAPQRVRVAVESVKLEGGGLPTTAANAVVSVEAGRDMEVACGDPSTGGTFASECALSGWSFVLHDGEYRAEKSIWARPRLGTTPVLADGGSPEWEVVLASESASNRRVRVVAAAPEAQGPSGLVREFTGTVGLELGGEEDVTLRLPVRAWADAEAIILLDESRTLSPTGRLRLGRAGAPKYVSEWLPLANGDVQGMTAEVEGSFEGAPLADTRVTGQFSVKLPRPVSGGAGASAGLTATFALKRVEGASPPACSAGGACAAGSTCEPGLGGGVCLKGGQPWRKVAGPEAVNNLRSGARVAWDDAGNARLSEALTQRGLLPWQLAQGLVCNQGSATQPLELAGLGTDVLLVSGDLRCANGAPPYVAELFTQRDRYTLEGADLHPELFDSEDLLSECLANLDLLPPSTSVGTADGWLTESLKARRRLKTDTSGALPRTPERCLSLARFFGALNLSARQANSRDQKFAWRLLQQWVGVHGFLAQETVRQHDVAEFLDGVTYPSSWPTRAASLTRMERGWDLLLDGAYAPLMPGNDETRTCGLLNPDYRLPQKPVSTWEWRTGVSTPIRGVNANWHRNDMTVVFDSPDVMNSCRSGSTSYLASLTYADDVAMKRRLLAQCSLSAPGTVNWGMQTLGQTPTGTDMRTWTGGTPRTSAQPGLRVALVERDGVQRLVGPGVSSTPAVDSFSYEHFLLLATPGGRVYGPATNRVGVWDHALTEAQLTDVLAQPEGYLGAPSADLRAHPSSRPHHAQGVGLPVAILEGLSAHVRLLVSEVELVERKTMATCKPTSLGVEREQAVARFGRTMRYVLTMESFAAAALRRELAQCPAEGEPAWTHAWNSARAELSRVRQQAYEKVRALNSCQPYGLPEDEAPLYFNASMPSGGDDATAKFFGSSTKLHAQATFELGEALEKRESAKQMWLQLQAQQVQNLTTATQRAQRIEGLKREYGRPIAELCGLTRDSVDILDAFHPERAGSLPPYNRPPLRPESCFVDLENPVCQVGTAALFAAVTDAQARFTLCTWNELRPYATLAEPRATAAEGYTSATLQACADGNGRCVRVGGVERLRVSELFGIPLTQEQMEAVPPGILGQAQEVCARHLGEVAPLPSAESVGAGLDRSCYRGDMGSAMLGLLAARQSLDVARSAWEDSQRHFELAGQHCAELKADQATRTTLEANHRKHMRELIDNRAAAEANAAMYGTFSDAASSLIGLGVAIAAEDPVKAISAGLDLVVGLFKSEEEAEARGYATEMEVITQQYEQDALAWELDVQLKACLAEAKHHLVGIHTAALQVERAMTDADAALLALRNQERTVRQRLTEGWAVVAQEEKREVPGFTHHFWLDGEILQAKAAFAWAKRVAYLLALSLEYETQQTQGVRQSIAEAAGPEDLEDALDQLKPVNFDQTLNGKFVEKHFLVLRLREQLLGIKDRVSVPPGERAWTGLQRMKHQLLAPERAVYDQKGNYLGQGFRFTMPELPPGFPDRCAERMWGVALYLSTESLSPWDSLNGIPLRLRKRNTFQSHLCADDTGPSDFQTRAARPSLRLGSVNTNGVGEENMYTPADIMAFTDSSTTALDAFKEGGSLAQVSFELKGRGLYGEYELIFPWKGLLQNGFPLDRVNDAYLRFEVLSVAKD